MARNRKKADQERPTSDSRNSSLSAALTTALVAELEKLIAVSRQHVAQSVNSELLLLCWRLGQRLRQEVLQQERAAYGEQIVSTVSRQLSAAFGPGFSRPSLFHMIRFAELWPDPERVATMAQTMGWSQLKELLYVEDPLARDFYVAMCQAERWSVRVLRERVRSMLYERTALSRQPDAVIRQELQEWREAGQLTPDLVFRDPYVLDFLGLAQAYSERDFEAAILRELERFLLELGSDFAFLARQKRMTVGGRDFHLDLLFYHRGLRRLVALELKLGPFEPAYKGQMELYLRWLDRYERQEGEEPPLGLILCSSKDQEQIELLQLNQGEIRVAEYFTALPERRLLEAKLHEAVQRVREQGMAEGKPEAENR